MSALVSLMYHTLGFVFASDEEDEDQDEFSRA
jgi:hypothetical protein